MWREQILLFYANKNVNYRHEKQNYNAFTPYDLTIPILKVIPEEIVQKKKKRFCL